MTQVRIDPSVGKAAAGQLEVYFVGPAGDAVYRTIPDGSPPTLVAALAPGPGRAFVFPNETRDGTHWDLRAVRLPGGPGLARDAVETSSVPVLSRFAQRGPAALPKGPENLNVAYFLERNWETRRPALRQATQLGPWTATLPHSGDSAYLGIEVSNAQTSESYRVGLEVPFLAWRSRTGTLLPNDQILYELQSDPPQVVLLDMPTRRIQVIALGSNPLATWNGAIPEH